MNYQDVIKQMQAEDPDFGKVSNSNPSEEFAFDIPGFPSIEEISQLTREQAIQKIRATDDFGAVVDQVPAAETTRTVFLDFCPRSLVLQSTEETLPVGAFVWEIADAIAREMCPRAAQFQFVCPPEEILSSRFERFYFSRNPNSNWWLMILHDPAGID